MYKHEDGLTLNKSPIVLMNKKVTGRVKGGGDLKVYIHKILTKNCVPLESPNPVVISFGEVPSSITFISHPLFMFFNSLYPFRNSTNFVTYR